MKQYILPFGFFLVFLSANTPAAEFSESVLKPTLLSPEGSITASFPQDGEKMSYYFSATVQKGELLTQIFFKGQVGREKRVELALLDENANLISAYWIHGVEARRDAIRSFPVEAPGRQLLRVTVSGPKTDEFRLEFGGSALAQSAPSNTVESGNPLTPKPSQ